MVLVPLNTSETFSGLVLDIHTPPARGIFDLDKSRDYIKTSIEEFFQVRGVPVVAGFRPGIGATSGGPAGWLAQLTKAVPAIGKLLFAAVTATRVVRRRIADYKKKQMRPFKPGIGVHLDIWPALDVRQRTQVSTLMET